MRRHGDIWLACYIATIYLANFFLARVGLDRGPGPRVVAVLPGMYAPSGVLMVGLAFTFRDLAQDALGRTWTIAAILLGALLSATVSPGLAFASGATFLVSETLDMIVYTPIRERGAWLPAVVASNLAALAVDSALFLWLAFGNLAFLVPQIVGKVEMTALAVVVLWLARRVVDARRTGGLRQTEAR